MEASLACLGTERETPRCFQAHDINSSHRPSPPLFHTFSRLTLSLISLSSGRWFLSYHRGVDQRRSPCTIAAFPPPPPLRVVPRIVLCDQGPLHWPDFNLRRLYNVGEASKEPQSPLFHPRSTHIWIADVRLMTCMPNLLGLGLNWIIVQGLFPLRTLVFFFVVLRVLDDFVKGFLIKHMMILSKCANLLGLQVQSVAARESFPQG
jgi:hypothetical protein